MENLDVMVLRTLRDWRLAGRRALLATVVRTWGSSPRPVGSIMALCQDGSVVGSVSGGCIEDDLIYRYSRANTPEGSAGVEGISHDIGISSWETTYNLSPAPLGFFILNSSTFGVLGTNLLGY